MRIVFPQDGGVYQQDIAECHTTDSVRAWFKEHQDQFIVLPCPENSPDLSPINNLLNPLDRVVRVMDLHARTLELQEILNEEHQETHRNVSPSEQEKDERGPMQTSTIQDILKKWEDVRAMVSEWHPNQADISRVGDLYNANAINYFRKILIKREKQSTLDMFFNTP
ncbi:uncharacterized protein TNCV_2666311 [Trichonephila clavipes]|nr:uncharacterized protein TNCV_2666311 [Trichonephila clavipes]